MRLICPECDANYEVDAQVIPDNGRDVQCSACGTTWFQQKETPAPAAAPVDANVAETVAEPAESTRPETRFVEIPRPQQQLDEAVVDILREEAAIEETARAAERDVPGLAESLSKATEDTPRNGGMAQVSAEQGTVENVAAAVVADSADNAHRADLLPDIDMINSTLRAAAEDTPDDTAEAAVENTQPARGGFRRGFLMMILLLIIAVVIYSSAPKIIEFWPAGAPYLTAYVDWVDGLRIWIDGFMGNAADSLSGLTDTSGN